MALVLADRIKETTTTTGTGTITLAGAATGYRSFATVGNGNTTYYTIAGQGTSEWEVGIGTYTSSGTTLSRTTVLASSNSGSLVNFSAGTKDVFVTYPAGKSVNLDANGGVTIAAPTSGAGLTVNASAATPTYNLGTTGATMTIDCTKGNVFYTTLTSATNVTTVTVNNPQDGQTINIFVTQPGSGTVATMVGTWAKWPGGVAGVLSTTLGAVDLIVATYRSSTGFWYATLSKAFA